MYPFYELQKEIDTIPLPHTNFFTNTEIITNDSILWQLQHQQYKLLQQLLQNKFQAVHSLPQLLNPSERLTNTSALNMNTQGYPGLKDARFYPQQYKMVPNFPIMLPTSLNGLSATESLLRSITDQTNAQQLNNQLNLVQMLHPQLNLAQKYLQIHLGKQQQQQEQPLLQQPSTGLNPEDIQNYNSVMATVAMRSIPFNPQQTPLLLTAASLNYSSSQSTIPSACDLAKLPQCHTLSIKDIAKIIACTPGSMNSLDERLEKVCPAEPDFQIGEAKNLMELQQATINQPEIRLSTNNDVIRDLLPRSKLTDLSQLQKEQLGVVTVTTNIQSENSKRLLTESEAERIQSSILPRSEDVILVPHRTISSTVLTNSETFLEVESSNSDVRHPTCLSSHSDILDADQCLEKDQIIFGDQVELSQREGNISLSRKQQKLLQKQRGWSRKACRDVSLSLCFIEELDEEDLNPSSHVITCKEKQSGQQSSFGNLNCRRNNDDPYQNYTYHSQIKNQLRKQVLKCFFKHAPGYLNQWSTETLKQFPHLSKHLLSSICSYWSQFDNPTKRRHLKGAEYRNLCEKLKINKEIKPLGQKCLQEVFCQNFDHSRALSELYSEFHVQVATYAAKQKQMMMRKLYIETSERIFKEIRHQEQKQQLQDHPIHAP